MIKRFSAITFILLANFVLLVLIILPHHHHQNSVCFVNGHCEGEHGHEAQDKNGNDHEHDKNNDFNHCLLKQVIVLPSQQIKAECIHFSYVDNHSSYNGIQSVLATDRLFASDFSTKNRLVIPFIPPISLRVSIDCKGLRAPPIV